MSGTLFVVATPIGNLEDLTPRARQTLTAVDFIAAEDTRHTRRLLSHFGIKTRLLALHDHNEEEVADTLVNDLAAGSSIAEAQSLRPRYPQILVNVRMDARRPLDAWPAFQDEMARQESALEGVGRLVIRYSGTEPLLRIMAEGNDEGLIGAVVDDLAAVIGEAAAR